MPIDSLEPGYAFSEIVDEGEKGEARDGRRVEISAAGGPGETSAEGRVAEQRLEDSGDVEAMVNKRMPSRTTDARVNEFSPKVGGTGASTHRRLRD